MSEGVAPRLLGLQGCRASRPVAFRELLACEIKDPLVRLTNAQGFCLEFGV